jgi:predicted ATP-dependent protease
MKPEDLINNIQQATNLVAPFRKQIKLLAEENDTLKSKLTKAMAALSNIESLTFSWVMTKENAEDILLVVAPIRDAVRKTKEEIKL